MFTELFTELFTVLFTELFAGLFVGLFTEQIIELLTELFTELFTELSTEPFAGLLTPAQSYNLVSVSGTRFHHLIYNISQYLQLFTTFYHI